MASKIRFILLLCLVAFRPAEAMTTLASFRAGNGGWQMGTIAVGNIDSDPELEIIVPYRDSDGLWHIDAFKWNGAHIAGFPYNSGYNVMNTSPTLYDLKGDGKNEIIFTAGNALIALNGDGSVFWSNAVTSQTYIPQGGFQTVTNGFYLTTDNQFHPTLPTNADFYSEVSSPIVADFSGTGHPEIATAWKIQPDPPSNNQDYNPFISEIFGGGEWGTVGEDWSGGVVFFDALTGRQDFVYHIEQLVETGLGVGRPGNAAPLNVYVLNDSDTVVSFDKTQPFGLYGNGELTGMFGHDLHMTTGFYEQGIDTYAADIDGDGRDELLSVTTQFNCLYNPHESVLDDDGALLWRQWKEAVQLTNNEGWLNNACMIPVNPDHTNRVSILSFTHSTQINFRQWNGINFQNRPGWPKDFAPYLPTPPVVGDVDGDGRQEIIIGTYDPSGALGDGNLYVFALDGTLKDTVPVPGGLKHIPFLADVNNDGSLDVVYRSMTGQVYVQNFGATSATNVSWATHRGNAQRNGNLGVSLFPPNTPLITQKTSGTRKTSFQWGGGVTNLASEYRIYRASDTNAPFQLIAEVPASVTSFTDFGLTSGWMYFYEVSALVNGQEIYSSPCAILSYLNSNLLANPAFEENDNSHWDKWNTGNISWTNMIGSINAHQGRQSMRIIFQSDATTDTINQYAQYGIPRAYIPVTPGTLYSFGGFMQTALDQPTTNWFEWTSTLTGEDYSSRPLFPYPNYFTPNLTTPAGTSSWVYLNRVFVMPAGFPNVELRHRFSTTSPATGSVYLDDMFFRALPAPGDPRWKALVPFGAMWRYSFLPQAGNWYATNFSDSLWPLAPAKFGTGPSPTNVATPLPGYLPAYYFRGTFNVAQTNQEELLLAATCTDDYGGVIYPMRVWLNGVEVISSGVDAVSFEGNAVNYFDLTPFQNLLHSGANLVAIQLSNTWEDLTWDNVAFDVSLQAIPSVGGAAKVLACRPGSGTMSVEISAPIGCSVRLDSEDRLGGIWQEVQTISNLQTNIIWITDTGQNGRLPPPGTTARFYRVTPF
ncbi:MAG TPA: VCBS repeat-containing protein [Candidatus Saccharimonadales bacterium]|nr:VCBS repeat-containing protein [Candidatus Saccharimonadales bacterium]